MIPIVLCVLCFTVASSLPKFDRMPIRDVLVRDNRIVNGSSPGFANLIFQVLLKIEGITVKFYTCGGALISTRWVLTAAHCLYRIRKIHVKLGGILSDLNGLEDGYTVIITTYKYVLHENFNIETYDHDIALVDLLVNVVLSKQIGVIRIGGYLKNDVSVRVSGWGKTSNSSEISEYLHYVDLTSVKLNNCEQIYGGLLDSVICATGVFNKSVCSGDDGGPVIVKNNKGQWVHVGIVSFGNQATCEGGGPVVFTRTSSYIDWIKNNKK